VLYDPEIVLTYRYRADSISNAPWSAAKMRRYAAVWRQMHTNIKQFGLDEQLGNTAVKFAEAMVWKLQANGVDQACDKDILKALEDILADAGNASDRPLLFWTIDQIKRSCGFIFQSLSTYRRLTRGISIDALLDYYRSRLSDAGASATAESTVRPSACEVSPVGGMSQDLQTGNDQRIFEALFICDRCLIQQAGLVKTLTAARMQASQAEAHYDAVIRSSSWRITEPLRRLSVRISWLRGS